MMEDLVGWRVHDHQKKTGHPSPKRPKSVRPPEGRAIWHNAFHELVGDNAGPIADMFAASAAILSGGDDARMLELADAHQELATSVGEAIQLSRRIGHKQLGIPLNKEFDGKLMCLGSGMPAALRIGRMIFHILGPFEQDLDNLLKEWNAWLQAKKDQLKRIQARAKIDEESLTAGAEQIMALTAGQARELAAAPGGGAGEEAGPPEDGDRPQSCLVDVSGGGRREDSSVDRRRPPRGHSQRPAAPRKVGGG